MDHEMKRSKLFLKVLKVIMVTLFIYGFLFAFPNRDAEYLPFAVEYYEIKSPNELHIYFNREIKKEEGIVLDVTVEGINSGSEHHLIAINQDTQNKIYTYTPESQEQHNIQFDRLINHHIMNKDTIKFTSFQFKKEYARGVHQTFEYGKPWFIHHSLLDFQAKDLSYRGVAVVTSIDVPRKVRMNLFKYAFGEFDSLKRKQGYWHWHYSNGSLLAEGTFKDDTLVDSLVTYRYQSNR